MTQIGIKISELPAAANANSTDQFETNQAGVSRRVTLDQMQLAAFGGALSAEMKAWLVTPTSVNLIAAVTDESGTGSLVFSNDPVFTGDPQAPTPPTGDNDTSIATTAFVKAQGYATVTYVDAADALKASIVYVDAADALKAPLADPVFTGNPRAPTPAPGDNDTSIATTAFVAAAIAEGASITVGDTPPVSPNDNQLWWNSVLGTLFLYYNDGNTTQWVPATRDLSAPSLLSANDTIVYMAANTTLGSATVDLCNTGAIGAAGEKWEVGGVALIDNAGAAATVAGVSIWDGSAYVASGGGVMGWATSDWPVTTNCQANVTLTGPTTFTLRGTGNTATARAKTTGAGPMANRATYIWARRIS